MGKSLYQIFTAERMTTPEALATIQNASPQELIDGGQALLAESAAKADSMGSEFATKLATQAQALFALALLKKFNEVFEE